MSAAKPTNTAKKPQKPAKLESPDAATSLVVQTKKKDMIERVTALSGVKKRDVGLVLDAVFAAMAEDLSTGKELNLPPLGKIKVNRTKDMPNGMVLNARIKLPSTEPKVRAVPLAGAEN